MTDERKNPENSSPKPEEGSDLLRVEDLSVAFPLQAGGEKTVVKHVSFSLKEGEVLGIAGESGSGKSMTALAVMGLLPENAIRRCGSIRFDGQMLCKDAETKRSFKTVRAEKQAEERVRQELSGSKMTMIFQEPLTSLNPVMTIKKQMEEPLLLHTKLSAEEREAAVLAALRKAELKHAKRLLNQYPHQLSGGMRQRVMIAMAMINRPRLLICDEPTTALDAVTEREIVSLIRRLAKEQNTAVIFISHDLSVLRSLSDRVMIMKDGRAVEEGTTERVFEQPEQEYTKTLMKAAVKGAKESTEQPDSAETVLSVEKVSVVFKRSNGLFRVPELKQAVSEVSFAVKKGEIFGIVGESGCGKSTLLKAVSGLLVHYEGTIWRKDGNVGVQMVFQDPYTSLNPAKRVGWILEEPLRLNTVLTKEERRRIVGEILKETELPADVMNRHISELSGGQRQRVAIAAALITRPELVLLDEPVSALDVTVQAQILELLLRLQREHALTYVFVSHDMAVVRKICDRVMVMKDGRVVECGATEELFLHPKESYTKRLMG
ncbi:MAG: ABC transporter ATP-binding protein [Lachnospiraceae bacterium]|nr:ABC transporter ATP-binding protein [Lachnospiraceae bacterium]